MSLIINTVEANKTAEIQGSYTGAPHAAFEAGDKLRLINVITKVTSDYEAPFIIDGVAASDLQEAVTKTNAVTSVLTSGISETITSLTLNTNTLTYTDENGADTNIDLSQFLDDTNLARITEGSLNPITGIVTFTRDDASTFTVDLSALLDNQSAADVAFTPDGDISAANVQGAIIEVRDDADTKLSTKADLVGGIVPANQLPASLDDVLEYDSFALLPVTGEVGKLYLTKDTNNYYRWSGSGYALTSTVREATEFEKGLMSSAQVVQLNSSTAKTDFISVTQAVDLDALESEAAANTLKLSTIEDSAKDDQSAAEVPYTNTTSGLTATDVQAAIDELDGRLDTVEGTSHDALSLTIDDATSETLSLVGQALTVNLATTTTDGAMSAEFADKLTNIEPNATADQTDAEIKTAYENNADTNAFTDAEKTKLLNITDNFKGYFADATARDTAITSPAAGFYVIQNDTSTLWYYDGATWINTGASSSGDMLASVYDPNTVQADVFNVDNHVSGTTNKVFTATEQSNVASNTLKVSADGSIDTHSDVDTTTTAPTVGQALIWDGANFTPQDVTSDIIGWANLLSFQDATYFYDSYLRDNGEWVVKRFHITNLTTEIAKETNNPTQTTQPLDLATCQTLIYT